MSQKLQNFVSNYLNSGWTFEPHQNLFKYRFRLINSIFFVAFIALIQGIITNTLKGYNILVYMEIFFLFFFIFCIYLLRRNKDNYALVTSMIAILSLGLFNALILFSKIEDIKFIWLFFYVVTFMFLRGNREGYLWIVALFISLILVQFQPFFPSYLDLGTTIYLIFVLSVVTATTYFFQQMIDKGTKTIIAQNKVLQERMETIEKQEKMMIDQSRMAAMGEMIRMIAHQWRQPLSTASLRISNYQINALMTQKTDLKRDELLEEINTTLNYLSETINDFQNYFKPDSELGCNNLYNALQQSIDFSMPRLKQSGIDIDLTCNDAIQVRANSNELIQIVLNLLNNAIDAIRMDGGTHRHIDIRAQSKNDHVVVEIEDSGVGIDKEVLQNLFEPYISTKGKNGTGLGLYMAKMIVEKQFGGSISAENRERGAVFILTLERCDGII